MRKARGKKPSSLIAGFFLSGKCLNARQRHQSRVLNKLKQKRLLYFRNVDKLAKQKLSIKLNSRFNVIIGILQQKPLGYNIILRNLKTYTCTHVPGILVRILERELEFNMMLLVLPGKRRSNSSIESLKFSPTKSFYL